MTPNISAYFADAKYLQKDVKVTKHNCKKDALKKLRERIFQNRHSLFLQFTKEDKERDGIISEEQWITIMSDVLKLHLNWKKLLPHLVKAENHQIRYTQFLDRYQVAVNEELQRKWQNAVVAKICEKIMSKSQDLKQAFKSHDKDGNGSIDYDEFIDIMKDYQIGLSNEQIYDLMRSIDTDKSGTIEYSEFMDRFKVQFNATLIEGDKEVLQGSIREISSIIFSQHKEIKNVFKAFDVDGDGSVNYDEFSKGIEQVLGITKFKSGDTKKLAAYIDKNKTGRISFRDFQDAFKVVDNKSNAWGAGVLQTVLVVIYRSRVQLKTMFRLIDVEDSGVLSVEDFKAGMLNMNECIGHPLSITQIEDLAQILNKDGKVDYEAFLNMMQVSDGDQK